MQLLSARLKSCLFGLRNLKTVADKDTLLKVYHGYFRGSINYLLPYMGLCSQVTLDPILKADRAAIRIIMDVDFLASTKEHYKSLDILPIDKSIEYYGYKFMFKYNVNKQPKAFDNCWRTNLQRQADRNLRNVGNFVLPNFVLPYNALWNHPLYAFPKKFNELPLDLKHTPKLSTFCRLIKERLMNEI